MSDEIEGWSGYNRSDGLCIGKFNSDGYGIYDKEILLTAHCPCCGKPLRTTRAAKLVANALYPLVEQRP